MKLWKSQNILRAIPVLALVLVGLFHPTRALGQATGSATVSGSVTDPTGARIPAAEITLTNRDRGSQLRTQTNEAGLYLFPDVAPGTYTIRVVSTGFETAQVSAFPVEVGQRASINITLQLGQVTDVVTVDAGPVLVETESNALGTVVDSKRVNELPLNGRNFLQLAVLSAGAAPAVGRATQEGQIGHPGRFVTIGGVKASVNSYMVNGIQIRGARLGELALNLSIANIDQFKVQQNFFMPDQGPNPVIVNVTTKGGGNEFHGQVFHFLRNVKLDARNFFSAEAENLKRNQFGFAVGGPIKKDKIWFYGGYEGLREVTGFVRGAYTPTQQMFNGNFAETEPIFDPLTFSQSAGTRLPFANNVIPNNRINAVSKRLLDFYQPGSSLAARPNNLLLNPRNTLDEDQFNFRIDTALTDEQSLFGQFIYSKGDAIEAGLFRLNGAAYPNEVQLGMVQHTWAMTPALVNTARVGFSRNVALFSNEGRSAGPIARELGFVGMPDPRGIPSQGIQGFSGFGRSNGDLGNLDNNYQLDEGLNYVKGNHQFRFGTSIRYRRTWQQNANAGAVGNVNYQATFSAQLQRNAQGNLVPMANTGNSFADFLLGMPTTGSTRGLPMLPYRFTQYMPYFQDTWKVARNFTLNYGISWFKDTIPNPQKWARDYPHGFDTQTGLLKFAVLNEVDPRIIQPDNNNFAPRLGFSWQVREGTVIRAGSGMYYSDQQLIELQFAAVGPPFNRSTDIVNVGEVLPVWEVGKNVFPVTQLPPIDQNFARNLPAGEAPFLLNETGRTPYVWQWNFSLQQSLGRNDMFEIAYLGNTAHKQQTRYDFNQCIVGADLRCDRATRPYLRYTSLLRADYAANANYNAFISRFEHRAGTGLNLRVEYAWAKALTDGWEIGGATNAQITNNRAADKDHTSFDVRHRAVMSAIWDIPFGRGRMYGSSWSRPLDAILGGWTLTGIATFSSGTPILMTGPNRTGSPFVDHRPNRVCQGNLSNVDLRANLMYLDTSCFPLAAQGFFGTSSRAPLHGPGINNWDTGIQKFFNFTEDMRLQFRAEMFNAFNHTQFGNPNSNAGAPNFGLVGGARAPRLVQLALRLLF